MHNKRTAHRRVLEFWTDGWSLINTVWSGGDMDWELWGTYSVGDHLRKHAFVADILLYDRLVIPIPPESDSGEQQRWRDMGWVPDRQFHLLELLGKERAIRVPWTNSHRQSWELRYRDALSAQRRGLEKAKLRSQMADAAATDVTRALKARSAFDWDNFNKRGGQPEEVDQLAHFTTRELLVDWSNMKNDTRLFMGLPPVQVDAVVAYGSYSAFSEENQVLSSDSNIKPSSLSLNLFGWEFLVPNDSKQSEDDLLKQALELASLDETKRHREVFHRWRRDMVLAGKTGDEMVKDLEDAISQYREAIRKSKIITGVKYAFAVVSAGLGVAAVAVPPLGIPAAFAGLGSFVVGELAHGEVAQHLKIAAMFYDTRKQFGWYS
jgi:hypothetical protein